MALSFAHATRRIGIPQADAQPLLVQAIIDAIRAEEASERGICYEHIADAVGKDDLGGGVATGITLSLRSTWKLEFQAGAYQATLSGGNLADALARVHNTGSPQVLIASSAASTAVATGGASGPSAATIAAEVLTVLGGATIPVDVKRVNSVAIKGAGVPGDTWGPA